MIAVEEGQDTLGKNIKSFREARHLSQSQLAERLWIIADELKLSLDELVGRKTMEDD